MNGLTRGLDAFLATIMKQLNKKRPINSFQLGIRNVSYMMIGFMIVSRLTPPNSLYSVCHPPLKYFDDLKDPGILF